MMKGIEANVEEDARPSYHFVVRRCLKVRSGRRMSTAEWPFRSSPLQTFFAEENKQWHRQKQRQQQHEKMNKNRKRVTSRERQLCQGPAISPPGQLLTSDANRRTMSFRALVYFCVFI